ncbi:MAG: hypothetical protein HN742_36640 [Lentisphaerae bacterium]|jgi:hypothetical protein|nr:hypothetical protein [Lentisphaerota bacterium]MBT4820451.1 hypothetical protein [Lentisphaerota bacterium]MBT5609250.1 hypothetical protein [Lentisphaerota bacterium]MBT7055271.1 hypothetical protein [Lentisphaerota bacterium]MBT7847454.1 hypothetical protein [Lentisphaerota bacterium]
MLNDTAPQSGAAGRQTWFGLAGALLLSVPVLHAAQNLAPNPSLEPDLSGWQLWSEPGTPPATLTQALEGRHGARGASVLSRNSRAILYSQAIPLNGDTDYTLSAYARTDRASGARLGLWVQGKKGGPEPWSPITATAGHASMLPNTGFEDGTAGWTLWHGAPGVSSGQITPLGRNDGQAFQVTNPGTHGANLHSDPVPCTPGRTYSLLIYAKTQRAQGVGIAVWARDADGKTLSYAVGGTISVPDDVPEYRLFSTTIVAPEGSADLKAHLVCNGGDVWWDDCLLTERDEDLGYELPAYLELPRDQHAWARFKHIVRTPAECRAARILLSVDSGTTDWDAIQLELGRDTTTYTHPLPSTASNQLPNSGFETGTDSWILWHQDPGRSKGGISEGNGLNDSHAFSVRNTGDRGANLFSETVPSVPGQRVTLSAYVRVTDGRDVKLAGWGLDGLGKTISYAIEEATPIPSRVPRFTRFSKTFTVPEDATGLRAHLICNGGTVEWDDVQLEEGSEPTPYKPGPIRERLKAHSGPEAVAYTRAIIREARLRDVLAQAARLVTYSGNAGNQKGGDQLMNAWEEADTVSALLDSGHIVPRFSTIDYTMLRRQADTAEEALRSTWTALGYATDGLFDEWSPDPLPPNMGTQELAREFLIFPCFTRPYFFRGEGNWDLLRPFGFRLISGWWGVRCDADGNPVTDGLASTLDVSRQNGYPCDITFDPAATAARALGNLEPFYLHNAEGGWSLRGNCHNTVNIWHPDVRRLAAAFSEKVARLYAGSPALLSYEMTNEPALTIQQHVHGYEFKPDGVGGYSPEAQTAWRIWLEEQHGGLDELNRRWRTQYPRFEDIEPPTELTSPVPTNSTTPVDCGRLHDFQRFRADSHADWFRMCLEAFRRGDPNKAVISQFVSSPMQRKDAAVDLRVMAEDAPWGFYGTHDWPGDRPAVESLYAVCMNRRSRHPHWEDEFIWSQWEKKGTPEPVMRAALERNLWRQVAWGKRGISLFNLESEWAHDSARNWNNSMLNIEADLAIPRYSTGIIPTVERKVNQFKEVLYGTELGPADIALLRPTVATLVAAPDGRSKREGTAIAKYLLRKKCVPVILPEEHIVEDAGCLERIRVVIAPWAINVPDRVQIEILEWIKAGGLLISSGPFGLYDQFGAPTGHVLKAIRGNTGWRYDRANSTWVCATQVGKRNSPPSPVTCGDGGVAILGQALDVHSQQEIVANLCREQIPVPLVATDLESIEVVPRQNATGQLFLFVTNLDAKSGTDGTITVRGNHPTVLDLSCDARPQVPVTRKAGTTTIPISLHSGGGVFLRLGRAADLE